MSQRVVVTGLGVVSPVGNDVDSFWQSLRQGKSGINNIASFDTTCNPVKVAAEVTDLQPEQFIGKHDAKHNARFMQFARIAARQAYDMSGLENANIDSSRFGVYVSSSIGGIEIYEKAYETFDANTPSRVTPYLIPNTLVNLASGAVAIDLRARGRNLAVVTACASGANAIGEAFKAIQSGGQDVIIAGASDAAITPLTLSGFAAMRAMYTGSDPTRACVPFDNERSGTVMGEGAGIVVLEDFEHAKKRNATILAEIIGYGTNCGAYSITTPEPEAKAISQAMQDSLDDAGIKSTDVDYINAHGTATILNDKTESLAIHRVFGESSTVLVSSTKSMTGHLLGAGGAIETIACIKALQDGFVPATINHRVADPACKINLVVNKGREKNIDVALTNSFGFGGHNACLVIRRWQN